ncbi:class I lanthipeptide [Taibaiella koreensis]|uniref:class I lanthipeptide n=1 Tax=Taibaiella koreensis TaxID=1268548 RepID=UPI0013C2D296|nr:class I lanthipeptide [Taibaiella koreensis]
MKKKLQSSKLNLAKKEILSLSTGESRKILGGVNTNANCPPSVGCTKYQPCITCNCPDW